MGIVGIAPQGLGRFKRFGDLVPAAAHAMPPIMFQIGVLKILSREYLVRPAGIGNVGVVPAHAGHGVMHAVDDAERRAADDRPIAQRP